LDTQIIILNWNNYPDTKKCLDSVFKITSVEFKVILVDNGSTDGSVDRIGVEFPKVNIIKNRENLGFCEGNNIGIRKALENGSEYIMLLNNDTVVDAEAINNLIKTASSDNNIGIVSPKILFMDNPNKIWFCGGYYRSIIKKPYHKNYGKNDSKFEAILNCDWVSGCCMLIKSSVFGKIGFFDEDYFANCEDVDLCIRAKKAGFRIVVDSRASIYHKFASSFGGKYSPFYTYFRTRNVLLLFKKQRMLLPLIINLFIFPFYSIVTSLFRLRFKSVLATIMGVYDFAVNRVGFGSASKL